MLLVAQVRAEVRVFIQDTNGVALLKYECTGGEVVRAFALDVTVDRGEITGISDFFRGESKLGATGYGIFPASFRDYLSAEGTNIDWNGTNYTPLADVSDALSDTLPGLNSNGVTLELGALWDPTVPGAIPGPSGTLCALNLSEPATVTVRPNLSRGGIVSAFSGIIIGTAFAGAAVGPAITSQTLEGGVLTLTFQDGELQKASSLAGPWTDTGNSSGTYTERLGNSQVQFYRVRKP